MSGERGRLTEYILAYGHLVDEIAEAVAYLPEDCRAVEILESAVKNGFESLYPKGHEENENE